ncbi:MFS transporter, partial [Lentilactobacillus rapi]
MENSAPQANKADVKLPLLEKISYSFTDMAGNLLYVTISSYILYFYTDVFGISVAGAGLILLVARFFDAVSAPVWGSIVDHTHTKWGQSRPYFLWLAIPFAVATFLE